MSLEPMPTQGQPQPETSSIPIPQPVEPVVLETKPTAKRSNVFTILMVLFSLLLFLIAAGLGYWAYTLNNQLTATQQQLSTLQTEHTQLKADYETLQAANGKLTTELTQTKADLEKSKSDLATAQAALTRSHDQNAALLTQINAALRKAEALYAFANVKQATDFFAVDTAIQATHDNQLISQWKKLTNSPSAQGSTDLILYLITSVRDTLK